MKLNSLTPRLDREATIWPLCSISSSGQSALIKKRGYPHIMSIKSNKKYIKSLWLFPDQSKTWVVDPRSRRQQDGSSDSTVEGPEKTVCVQDELELHREDILSPAHQVESACLAPPTQRLNPQVILLFKNVSAQQRLQSNSRQACYD